MRTRIIHLVNPKTDSLTTRPLYMNRALYSPLAGLLAVAAAMPRERYEHQGCTFCAEPLMNGLKFRYRPVHEVIQEMENCGSRIISINDADFFGTPERPSAHCGAAQREDTRCHRRLAVYIGTSDGTLQSKTIGRVIPRFSRQDCGPSI